MKQVKSERFQEDNTAGRDTVVVLELTMDVLVTV